MWQCWFSPLTRVAVSSMCCQDVLAKPSAPNRFFFRMPPILLLDQQVGDLTITDQNTQVGQKFGDLWLGHLRGIVKG